MTWRRRSTRASTCTSRRRTTRARCSISSEQAPARGRRAGRRTSARLSVHLKRRHVVDPPKAVAAAEGGQVVAEAHASRELVADVLGVAAAQHDVIGEKRLLEVRHQVEHRLAPRLLANLLERLASEDIAHRAFLEVQVPKLERDEHMIGDERGADAGAKTDE